MSLYDSLGAQQEPIEPDDYIEDEYDTPINEGEKYAYHEDVGDIAVENYRKAIDKFLVSMDKKRLIELLSDILALEPASYIIELTKELVQDVEVEEVLEMLGFNILRYDKECAE